MDYPWIINPWILHGLSIDNPWIIHGSSMDYPWIINGSSMDYPWMSMDNPWASLDFHGLPGAGGPVGHVGGTDQHIPGELFGWETLTHSLYRQ